MVPLLQNIKFRLEGLLAAHDVPGEHGRASKIAVHGWGADPVPCRVSGAHRPRRDDGYRNGLRLRGVDPSRLDALAFCASFLAAEAASAALESVWVSDA